MARKKTNFFKKKISGLMQRKASNALWSDYTSFCFLDRVDYVY